MSDLTKLKEILDNQQPKGVKAGWEQLGGYRIERDNMEKEINLSIDNVCVGFVFTLRGRLKGIYNWKE